MADPCCAHAPRRSMVKTNASSTGYGRLPETHAAAQRFNVSAGSCKRLRRMRGTEAWRKMRAHCNGCCGVAFSLATGHPSNEPRLVWGWKPGRLVEAIMATAVVLIAPGSVLRDRRDRA